VELAFERATSAAPLGGEEGRGTALVVVGRGSSDPDANGDFCKLVRLVGEGRGLLLVAPAFAGIARPAVAETLEHVARARPAKIVILPYLLFAGRLVEKLKEQILAFAGRCPWIPTVLAPPLGSDRRLLALIDERAEQAEAGRSVLPCDTCLYRTEIPGFVEHVGGLRAMLWSVRHSLTHTQSIPHVHAHRPVKKHVLVCTNADCAARGGISVVDEMRRAIKRADAQRDVRVTRTSCMGRCGEGPAVVVYPDGVWYRSVRSEDASEIVQSHILGDRLVARLVDNVMQ
jgi:(2Fe-2S) ferredoxin